MHGAEGVVKRSSNVNVGSNGAFSCNTLTDFTITHTSM